MKATVKSSIPPADVKIPSKRRPVKGPKDSRGKGVTHQPYKGRKVYTVEEIAQRDCPFPGECEWIAELERFHADKMESDSGQQSARRRSPD